MPIRTASLRRQIGENGQALHRAMMSRGADQEPSEAERALIEERRLLKEERAKRQAQAHEPKAMLDKLVRTHHAQPKDKPAAKKDAKAPKDAKASKAHKPSRAEKHAAKAAALEAARRSPKRPAKPEKKG